MDLKLGLADSQGDWNKLVITLVHTQNHINTVVKICGQFQCVVIDSSDPKTMQYVYNISQINNLRFLM